MKNLRAYKKARKVLINNSKKIDRGLKNYLSNEIVPIISGQQFKNEEQEIDYYAKYCEIHNVSAMIYEFENNNKLTSDKKKSQKLLQVAKNNFKLFSDIETRLLINFLAKDLYKSGLTISAYAWTCIHASNYEQAAQSILELSMCPDYSNQNLERLKSSLAARLKIQNIDEYLATVAIKPELSVSIKDSKIIDKTYEEFSSLYHQGKDKEIATIIFNNYKAKIEANKIIDFILVDLNKLLGFSEKSIMTILIHTGKLFGEIGKKGLEVILVESAIDLKKNTMSMRSAFWAYQRQGNIEKSKEILLWLESYAHENNDRKLLDFVALRKNSYLFLTNKNFIDLIEKAKSEVLESYEPNPKTISYILHNSLPYASGGYATRGHGLATALAEDGYAVNIVTRPGFPLDTKKDLKPSEVSKLENIDGVEYHTILEPRRDKLPTFEYIKQASEKLIEKLLVIKPSLVVGASNHLTALPALIAARKLGIPFIYEVRGFWEITRISREPEFEKTEWFKLLCAFEALVASQADHVFTLTTPMAEELERRGVDKNKITILPNSCDPERFESKERDLKLGTQLKIPENVPVIGYIGTFVQYEGLEHLAEACGILKERGVEFRLLIVGNENTAGNDRGPITKSIDEVAKKYGFEEWLIMPGRIPHEEVEAYYSLIDIAPFPRKPQPVTEMVSPMKPLEAAAMKKAIVVSSVRALTDMITDKVNGLVFEKGNVEDFADKLLILVENDELRLELGDNARLWVETSRTWKATANQFSKTVENLDEKTKNRI